MGSGGARHIWWRQPGRARAPLGRGRHCKVRCPFSGHASRAAVHTTSHKIKLKQMNSRAHVVHVPIHVHVAAARHLDGAHNLRGSRGRGGRGAGVSACACSALHAGDGERAHWNARHCQCAPVPSPGQAATPPAPTGHPQPPPAPAHTQRAHLCRQLQVGQLLARLLAGDGVPRRLLLEALALNARGLGELAQAARLAARLRKRGRVGGGEGNGGASEQHAAAAGAGAALHPPTPASPTNYPPPAVRPAAATRLLPSPPTALHHSRI